VAIGSCRINGLLFAEPLVLLASFQKVLQLVTHRFAASGKKINMKNTEVLCLSRNTSGFGYR